MKGSLIGGRVAASFANQLLKGRKVNRVVVMDEILRNLLISRELAAKSANC
jgi:hypothetical protein